MANKGSYMEIDRNYLQNIAISRSEEYHIDDSCLQTRFKHLNLHCASQLSLVPTNIHWYL